MRRIAAIIALGLVLLGGGAAVWLVSWAEAAGSSQAASTVILPKGADALKIARQLGQAGVANRPLAFAIFAKLTGWMGPLRAGEYTFQSGSSPVEILAQIRAGRVVVHRLVVPEGLTSAEIVAAIDAAPGLVGEIVEIPAEGSLWPATYFYVWGDTRATLEAHIEDDARRELAALWSARAPGLPFAKPEEAVTLASLVEKETGIATERPKIAQLFLNRLKLGMKLQSDPTVIYALTHGATPLGRPLVHADLETPSPYNTYWTTGLPPGPIANPGRAALEAVLHPQATDALYFVADGSGGHAFAATLAAHEQNVARWRRIEAGGK